MERSCLEQLFKFCYECGQLIGRTLDFTVNGSNIVYNYYCAKYAVMENKMLNLNVDVEINAEEEADLEIELDQDFLVQNIIDLEIEDFDDFGLGALEID
uniref:Uncharacterized protein n=1 Tax=Acrobeloides nanus TaxID=290746 RepID=A0A914D9X3_9BILA